MSQEQAEPSAEGVTDMQCCTCGRLGGPDELTIDVTVLMAVCRYGCLPAEDPQGPVQTVPAVIDPLTFSVPYPATPAVGPSTDLTCTATPPRALSRGEISFLQVLTGFAMFELGLSYGAYPWLTSGLLVLLVATNVWAVHQRK